MDLETDFGLFEIALILGAVGVGAYLLYKLFSNLGSTLSNKLLINPSTNFGTSTQIDPNSATGQTVIACIESSVGPQMNMTDAQKKQIALNAIATENALNANPPNALQTAVNYWFGTSWGVNLGTAGKPNTAAPPASASGINPAPGNCAPGTLATDCLGAGAYC